MSKYCDSVDEDGCRMCNLENLILEFSGLNLQENKPEFLKKVEKNDEFIKECLSAIKEHSDNNMQWSEEESFHISNVPLSTSSDEHRSITVFMRPFKVNRIESVENPFLLIQYEMKKHEYKNKYGKQVQEKRMFH